MGTNNQNGGAAASVSSVDGGAGKQRPALGSQEVAVAVKP